MSKLWPLVLVVILPPFCVAAGGIYHNQIAVHVPGGDQVVAQVAKRSGMINLGRIVDLQDFYLLESHLISKR